MRPRELLRDPVSKAGNWKPVCFSKSAPVTHYNGAIACFVKAERRDGVLTALCCGFLALMVLSCRSVIGTHSGTGERDDGFTAVEEIRWLRSQRWNTVIIPT